MTLDELITQATAKLDAANLESIKAAAYLTGLTDAKKAQPNGVAEETKPIEPAPATPKPMDECLRLARKLIPDMLLPSTFDDWALWLGKFNPRTLRAAMGKLVDKGELILMNDGRYKRPEPQSDHISPPGGLVGAQDDDQFPIIKRLA